MTWGEVIDLKTSLRLNASKGDVVGLSKMRRCVMILHDCEPGRYDEHK